MSIPYVFLDANIIIRAGKPPKVPELERVADLVDAGLIHILTTDLTITEVSKKHANSDYDIIKDIARPHFRKLINEILETVIPEITKDKLKEILNVNYTKEITKIFTRLKAKVISIDDIKPSLVFQKYAQETGLFSGESKKNQFPDAFIFECIKSIAGPCTPVILVTDDKDFRAPTSAEECISIIQSLPELFKQFGFEMDVPEIEEFLNSHADDLIKLTEVEANNWGLVGDVEDSEIFDISVNDINTEIITAFKPVSEGDHYLAICKLKVKANVQFTHPDWDTAMYDSEDKVLLAFEQVSGETQVEFEVDASISISGDENGDPQEIKALSFRNSGFQYVELHPYDPYDYR